MHEVIIRRKSSSAPAIVDSSMRLLPMISRQDSPDFDFVWTKINGVHPKQRNQISSKMYLLIAGELDVATDDVTMTLHAGDVAIIPPGIWCELKGHDAEVGIVCCPALNIADDELFEVTE